MCLCSTNVSRLCLRQPLFSYAKTLNELFDWLYFKTSNYLVLLFSEIYWKVVAGITSKAVLLLYFLEKLMQYCQRHQILFFFCYIHQVTASALCAKKVDAYQKHVSLSTEQIVGKKTKLSPYVQVLESNYLV